jgi:hypothetical protein
LPKDGHIDAVQVAIFSTAPVFTPQLVASLCVKEILLLLSEMEACTEHLSARFKQSALIEFMLLIESLQLEFSAKCMLFMVMTVLM